jgi:AbrB family looped-hinge helix DNA binding protein
MRITSKGQVTIPQDVRETVGMLPGTDIEFTIDGETVRIVKSGTGKRPARGARAIARLRAAGGHVSMSTDEIMALTRGDS